MNWVRYATVAISLYKHKKEQDFTCQFYGVELFYPFPLMMSISGGKTQMSKLNQNYRNSLVVSGLGAKKVGRALNLAVIALELDTATYFKRHRRGKLFRDQIRANIRAIRTLRLVQRGMIL